MSETDRTEVRSSVKIETSAKGMAQPRIAAYEGVTEEEMQRLLALAILTYETAIARLGARANF